MYHWKELYDRCMTCQKCGLSKTRNNVVFGEGNLHADLMFIGEGPGADEDRTGRPFVGRAGQLLEKGLEALGVSRDEVYIANIVKCRPPNNRVPEDAEGEACVDWLRNQVALIRPKIIVCLGSTSLKWVVAKDARITKIRGEWIEKNGVFIMPTYHPAALLLDESKKMPYWHDLKKAIKKYKELCNESPGTVL